jgi:hypothetical protein
MIFPVTLSSSARCIFGDTNAQHSICDRFFIEECTMRTGHILFAMTVLLVTFAAHADEKAPVADPRQDMVEAARKANEMMHQRYLANEPLTPTFLDQMCTWSARVAKAECAIANSREERVAALERHHSAIVELDKRSKQPMHDGERTGLWTYIFKYYEAEARLWIAEEAAK